VSTYLPTLMAKNVMYMSKAYPWCIRAQIQGLDLVYIYKPKA